MGPNTIPRRIKMNGNRIADALIVIVKVKNRLELPRPSFGNSNSDVNSNSATMIPVNVHKG